MRAVVLLAAFAIALAAADVPTITTISPSRGGVLGGTRLTVLGSGFDERGRSNAVYIGTSAGGVFCDPIPNECTSSRIVCLTPKTELRGQQPLSVQSFGFQATCARSSGCYFAFSYDATPILTGISPEFVTDVADVTVSGRQFAQGDATVAAFDFTMHIGEEERCDFVGRTVSWSSFTCGTTNLPVPGNLPVDVQMGSAGNAVDNGVSLIVIPTITSVYPSNGSTAGGQIVTVTGGAFGRDITALKVQVHGADCRVTELEDTYLACETTAHAATTTAGPAYQAGKALVESWYTPEFNSIDSLYANLRSMQPDISYTVPSLGGYTVTGKDNIAATRWTTLFVPNVTGQYVFEIACDDVCELWLGNDETPVPRVITAVVDADPTYNNLIASCPGATSSFSSWSQQKSSNVTLVAGQRYWLQTVVINNGGSETNLILRASVNSGAYLFAGVVPGAYLQLPTPWAPPVQVWVGGVPASAGISCWARGSCDFNYLNELTATITSVTPAALTAATTLTIAGSGFSTTASANIVTIADTACTVTAATATQLTCTLAAPLPTGQYPVQIKIQGAGYARNLVQVSATPVISAASNTGGVVTITGSGFGTDTDRLTVLVGGSACAVTTLSNTQISCNASSSLTSGSTTVSVSVTQDAFGTALNAFVYDQPFVRPGTTTATKAPSVSATFIGVSGDELLQIDVPAWTFTDRSQLSVWIGTYSCQVTFAFASRIRCITRTFLTTGVMNVTVVYGSSSLVVAPIVVREQVTGNYPDALSPKDGNRIRIQGNFLARVATDFSISYGGYPCTVTGVLNNELVECIPSTSRITSFPVIATYSESNANIKQLLDMDSRVTVSSSGFKIPAGAYLSSKRSFGRNIAFSAYVMASSTTSCINMAALMADGTSTNTGYGANAGDQGWYAPLLANVGYWSITSDGWTGSSLPENVGTLSGFALSANSWQLWRLEVHGTIVRLYVDGQFIVEYPFTRAASGVVGFPPSCQDITVKGLTVEDLSAFQLQVNISGVPVPSVTGESTYDATSDARPLTGVTPTTVSGGTVLTFMGSNFNNDWTNYAYQAVVTSSATTKYTAASTNLCNSISIVSNTILTCTVLNSVTAGSYVLRLRTYSGFSWTSYPITVAAKINAITPAIIPSTGGIITIAGSGFSNTLSDASVTVGGRTCTVKAINPIFITCEILGLTGTANAVAVTFQSSTVASCTGCTVSVSDVNIPNVTQYWTYFTDGRGYARFDGRNLGSGTIWIGTQPCIFTSTTSTRIYCEIRRNGFASNTGALAIKMHIDGLGYAVGLSNGVTISEGIAALDPAVGSAAGGTALTVYGIGFALDRGTQVESSDFSSLTTNNGWTASPSTVGSISSTCDSRMPAMLGGLGYDNSVTKTITSIPTHSYLTLSLRIATINSWWWGFDNIFVTVDGTKYTFPVSRSMCTYRINGVSTCGNTNGDCVLDIPFTIPHSAASAVVKVSVQTMLDATVHPWGLLSTYVGYSTSLAYAVAVGSNVCPITYMDQDSIRCTTPAQSGSALAVSVTRSSTTLSCTPACTFNSTLGAPAPLVVALSPVANTAGANIDWTYVAPGLTAVGGASASVTSATSNGWVAAVAAQWWPASSGFYGIEFALNPAGETMVGLLAGGVQALRNSYEDIDFTIYSPQNGDLVAYERGSWEFGTSLRWRVGDKLRIIIDSGNNVHYQLNGIDFAISARKAVWPIGIKVGTNSNGASITGLRPLFAGGAPAAATAVPIVVAGTNWDRVAFLSAFPTVTINGTVAPVFDDSDFRTTVLAPLGTTAGSVLTVQVDNRRGLGAPQTFTVAPLVTGISATTGSSNGGHVLTIWGAGLSTSSVVTIGGVACTVSAASYTSLTCTTGAFSSTGAQAVVVSQNGVTAQCLSIATPSNLITGTQNFNCPTYTVNSTYTPSIATVVPTSITEGTTVTVTGTGFVPTTGAATAAIAVTLGSFGTCTIVGNVTATGFSCVANNDLSARATGLQVTFPTAGVSSTFTVSVPVTFANTASVTIGNLGGAVITVSGSGFGSVASDVSVQYMGSSAVCSSITLVSSKSFVCTTAALTLAPTAASDIVIKVGTASVNAGLVGSSAWITANAASAPTVTAVSPTSAAGQSVVITGTGLATATVVTVGSATCTVATASATSVTCTLASAIPATANAVSVTTSALGLASGAASVTGAFAISGVAPWRKAPGTSITIQGNAITASAPSNYVATVGGADCNVTATTASTVICTLPTPSNFVGTPQDVVVRQVGTPSTVTTSFTYTAPVKPTVSAVSPTTVSAAGGDAITITGTGFSLTPQLNFVTVAGLPCIVTSGTSTSLVCTAPTATAPIASADVVVTVSGLASTDAVTATLALSATAVSIAGGNVNSVSNEGGLVLTITGTGFPKTDIKYAAVTVGSLSCPLLTTSPTQLTCTLPAATRSRVKHPLLVNSYPAKPSGSMAVGVTVNGTVATATGLTVTYAAAATASITSVTAASPLATGGSITIVGTGFAASGNTVLLQLDALNGNSSTCTVTSESTTQIVCTVVATTFGTHFVEVLVPGTGFAQTAHSCPAGQFLMCDGSCVSNSDCTYAAYGFFADCQGLANLLTNDTFCHSNGGTDQVNIPFTLDGGKPFDLNCPMYSCEGSDCDTALYIGGHGGVVSTCRPDPNGFLVSIQPTITALSAAKTSSTNGGLRITITGTGLYMTSVIGIGSVGCTPISVVGTTSLVCETGASAANVSSLTLSLWTQGTIAVCSTTCSGYAFSSTATPTVTSVSLLSSGRPFCVAGAPLTITGTGFSTTPANNIFSVNGYLGTVSSATATQLVVSCPPNPSGDYSASLRVVDSGLATLFATSWRYRPAITGISANQTSLAGGLVFTITGSAFDVKSVTLAVGSKCLIDNITAVTLTQIVARTKPCATANDQVFVYNSDGTRSTCVATTCNMVANAALTASVTSSSQTATTVTIQGTNFPTAQSDVTVTIGDNTCTILSFAAGTTASLTCDSSASHRAGTYPIVVSTPRGWAAWGLQATKTFAMTVGTVSPTSGSLGGGQSVTITGTGFASTAALQQVTIGTLPCTVSSSTSTQIVCVTSPSPFAGAQTVTVTVLSGYAGVNSTSMAASSTYTYDSALTPSITGVSPYAGSTAGGTLLTVTGTNLAGLTSLTIEGVVCAQDAGQVSASTATAYYCTTGAYKTAETTTIVATTASNGNAVVTGTYQYVDLWSRWTTWGNTAPPAFGDSAVVNVGQTVILDYSPPRLFLIIVMGHMQFQNTTDLTLECTYVMINYGRFTIGTPSAPYTKKATIRLYGDRLTPEIPVHGAKVIALRHGGLDMHGIPRLRTWTTLTANAVAQSNTIQILGPVDWVAGESIAIAPTNYEPTEAEDFVIASIANSNTATVTITLNKPLQFNHWGTRQCFGTTNQVCVDEVAEVILLSRNIVVEGDSTSARNGFGGTMFLMPMGADQDKYARLSYIELRSVGQQYIVGRYPVHFHVTGNCNTSYVNGTSVHGSLNRAFSIHGTMNNTYVNNVAYDVGGNTFFIEDGSEKYNVIDNNVVMLTKSSTSNLNTDVTPANYWIVSPLNKVTNNRACGSDAYGFWISPFHPTSTGPTYSPNICPSTHQMWQMENNTAHSNRKYGLNVFQYWWPKQNECDFDGPDAQAIIRNHLSFKNAIHGVSMAHSEVGSIGSVKMDNLTSADNGFMHKDGSAFWVERIRAANMSYGVQNSVLIALTNNNPYHRSLSRRAINLPLGDNFFSENITFVNYKDENYGYEPQAWAERHSFCFPWGWEAVVKGLRWIDSPNRINFRFVHHGILDDMDGTLAGTAGTQVAPFTSLYDPVLCPNATGFFSNLQSVVCGPKHKLRRFDVSTMDSVWTDQLWTIGNQQEAVIEIKHKYSVTAPMNRNVSIDFQFAYNPTYFNWKMSPRFYQPGESTLFSVVYKEPRDTINATFDGVLGTRNSTQLDMTATQSAFWRANNSFQALLAYPTVQVEITAMSCPASGCAAPPLAPPAVQKACGSFDSAASWASAVIPASGADVAVTYQDSICLDRPSGVYNFGSLRVEGSVILRDSHCPTSGVVTINVAKYIHLRGGIISIGNSTNPITACKVNIVYGAVDFSNQGPYTLLPWGTRSLTVEAGTLQLDAAVPAVLKTRLSAPAAVGATQITVDDVTGWTAGQTIIIASTTRMDQFTKIRTEASERRVIATVTGNTIVLTSPLSNAHLGGAPQTLNGRTFRIGAVVALVDRLIEIKTSDGANPTPFNIGWNLNVGCTNKNTPGCGNPTYGSAMSSIKTADIAVNGIRLTNVGQARTFHAGIELDGLISSVDNATAAGSYVTRCFLDSTNNVGITVRDTTVGMRVSENVVFSSMGDGIRIVGANSVVTGNTVIDAGKMIDGVCDSAYFFTGDAATEDCRPGAFRVAPTTTFINNTAISATSAGFITNGDDCATTTVWSGNEALAVRDGVLVYDNPADPKYNWPQPWYTCRYIRGAIVHSASDNGVAVWYAQGNSVVIDNMVLVNNMVGISSIMYNSTWDFGDAAQTVKIQNSIIAGKWSKNDACSTQQMTCKHTLLDSFDWCQTFNSYAPFMANVGILESVFVSAFDSITGRTKGEHKFMWMEPDSYAQLRGNTTIDNVFFDNFDGNTACNTKSVAFYQNPFSNDTFHQHVFKRISWGSNVVNGGEFYARKTYGDIPGHLTLGQQSTWLDFDNEKFGAYWPDAPNKVWLVDLDGTFSKTGSRTQILASETLVRDQLAMTSLPWNGSGLKDLTKLGALRAGCTAKTAWNAFACDSTFQMLSVDIEHLGEDMLTRRVGPVVLCKGDGMMAANGYPVCQGSVIDFASGPVMKGKVQRATLDRIPRFRFVAEHGGNYTLYFRGVPPAWMRVRVTNSEYLNLGVAAGVTLNLRFFGQNSDLLYGVYRNGQRLPPVVGYTAPWAATPAVSWPSSTDPSGTHYHNKQVANAIATNVMSFVVREGDYVDLKAEPVVRVSMSVSMPIDQFFNQQNTFAAALASVLGIDSSRLKFVNIVAGTTRRQLMQSSSSTSVSMIIAQDSSTASASFNSGSMRTSGDLSGLVGKLSSISGSVGSFGVSNVAAALTTVSYPAPDVTVTSGYDYVLLNVTIPTGNSFSSSLVGTSAAAAVKSTFSSSPQNATQQTDVAVGNSYTDSNNYTRFTINLAYDSDQTNSNVATNKLAALLASSPSSVLPTGYSLVSYQLVKASTLTGAPTTTGAGGSTPAATATTTSAPTQIVTLPPTNSSNSPASIVSVTENKAFIIAIAVGLGVIAIVSIIAVVYFCVIRPSRLAEKAAADEHLPMPARANSPIPPRGKEYAA